MNVTAAKAAHASKGPPPLLVVIVYDVSSSASLTHGIARLNEQISRPKDGYQFVLVRATMQYNRCEPTRLHADGVRSDAVDDGAHRGGRI